MTCSLWWAAVLCTMPADLHTCRPDSRGSQQTRTPRAVASTPVAPEHKDLQTPGSPSMTVGPGSSEHSLTCMVHSLSCLAALQSPRAGPPINSSTSSAVGVALHSQAEGTKHMSKPATVSTYYCRVVLNHIHLNMAPKPSLREATDRREIGRNQSQHVELRWAAAGANIARATSQVGDEQACSNLTAGGGRGGGSSSCGWRPG